jgi:transcriptional regulator with XRE-family HTH domain
MANLSLSSLGTMLKEKRKTRNIREVAAEMGISSATLSRIENGKIPDLKTFSKICTWMKIDPSEILGCKYAIGLEKQLKNSTVLVHMRADKDLDKDTIQALTEMILRARTMIAQRIGEK